MRIWTQTVLPRLWLRNTSYLTRPEGRIGYDVAGEGPLVVLVPGMGDLRGQGDSDATFPSYGDEETADDVAALIEELGGPGYGENRRELAPAERRTLNRWILLSGEGSYDMLLEDTVVDDTARDRAIYQALKAADEVAAALQTHLIEEHGADPERAAPQSSSSNSIKLLRQARERLGEGLRAVGAGRIAESDEISLRNH